MSTTALQLVGASLDEEAINVALVPRHLVLSVWPRVEEILISNPPSGSPLFATPPQIVQALLDGKNSLWIGGEGSAIDAIHICSIVQYPAAKTLMVNYVGGKNLRGVMAVAGPMVEDWALKQGCTHIELVAPRAVMRILRRWGYLPIAEYACKPLVTFQS